MVNNNANILVEHHQVSRLSGNTLEGMNFTASQQFKILNCQVFQLEGSTNCRGVLMSGSNGLVSNCTMRQIVGVISSGTGLEMNGTNIICENCQISQIVGGSRSEGILIGSFQATDVVVTTSEITDIEATNGTAVGILGKGRNNSRLVLENNVTNNVIGTAAGYGVLFEAEVVMSSGVEHSIVRDCVAIGNSTTGFEDLTTNQDNSFLGNYADENTSNYGSIPSGNIVTFTKSTGIFGSTPNRWDNISAM